MRRIVAALALGVALLLTACAGLPTSGAVYAGNSDRGDEDAPAFNLLAAPPQPGASPQQIVGEFLRAGVSAQNDWATAREYLTPEFRTQWQPLANVTIDRLSERTTATMTPAPVAPTEPDTDAEAETAAGNETIEIVQRVTAEASVSDTGEYAPAEGRSSTLNFRLLQQDGEWRIADGPDGLVLHQEVFTTVFQQASLMYFDPSWRYLVPDVRWFPRGSLIAARVARALVEFSPSDWLGDSVRSAFPDNLGLASGAVPLDGSTAQVELAAGAYELDERTLDRMQTQLEESLASVDVTAVQMTVGTNSLNAQSVPVRTTRVEQKPLVELAEGGFGFLGADVLEPIPGLSAAVSGIDARAVAVSRDRGSAAVLTAQGAVVRARADGTMQPLDLARPGLLAPSIDSAGMIWSVPTGDPDAFLVYPDRNDAEPIALPVRWSAALEIAAFQVSRDGTRIAALVTANNRTEVWVAGIVRDQDVPVALGEPFVLATSSGVGTDLAWLDDANVGVLLRSDEGISLLRQPVGGRGDAGTVDSGVVEIAGGNSSARLRTEGGALLIERGAIWEEAADGVVLLGTSQGLLE